jgi:hypothetical protein
MSSLVPSTGWLANSSFDASKFQAQQDAQRRKSAAAALAEAARRAPSPASDDQSPEDGRSDVKKHKAHKHKRKRDKAGHADSELPVHVAEREKIARLEAAAARNVPRAFGAASAGAFTAGHEQIDASADYDNLAFDSLYAASVSSYRRFVLDPSARPGAAAQYGSTPAARYHVGPAVVAERSRRAKRVRLERPEQRAAPGRQPADMPQQPPPAFMAVPTAHAAASALEDDDPNERVGSGSGRVCGSTETREEYVLRRTREFNVALRETPKDETLWLDFAAFQVCLQLVGRPAARSLNAYFSP